jgi:cyclase
MLDSPAGGRIRARPHPRRPIDQDGSKISAPTANGHPDDAGLPPPHTVEVADRVFAYVQPDGSWWINNTGFLVGVDAVTAIDASSTERRTRGFLDAIARVAPLPVRTLVNTHHHGDHTNGNCLFGDATIIGHRNCRDAVKEQRIGGIELVFGDVDWGDLTITPPTVTFDDRVQLFVDDLRVDVDHIGTPAHTTGDVVLWLPEQRVLFAGDLVFNGGTPFVLMGSVAGSLAAVERLRHYGADTIVPGHGAVCGPERLDAVESYLTFVQHVAAEARGAGLSPLEAAREVDLGEYGEWLDVERIVGNLHRAYAELEGQPLGAPIDIITAFLEMIAFNGDRPLRCLA